MASTLRFLSGVNGHVPAASAYVIQFVRKPERFKGNRYWQLVPTDDVVFLYRTMERDHSVRVPNTSESVWHDGGSRKAQTPHNQGRSGLTEGRTIRRNLSFTLGWQAQDQARGWKPLAYEAASHASQMMTLRTKLAIDLLETTGTWPTSHTADANTLNQGAGNWLEASDDPASGRYLAIWKSISAAVDQIFLDTNSMVTWQDLRLVINPTCARKMAQSPEINNYIRESPVAAAQLKGELFNPNMTWGLPSTLRGLEIVVEDASIVTSRPAAAATVVSESTTTRGYVKSSNSAVIISRPGGLDGEAGAPNYSTLQCWHYKELMRVQSFDDPEDELTRGHVSEQVAMLAPAPFSGYLITNLFA